MNYNYQAVFWRRTLHTARTHCTWCHRRTGWSSVCSACSKQNTTKPETKDVLSNINRTQATEMAEKCRFCPWWRWHLTFELKLTFELIRARDQTRLPVNFVHIRSAVPRISYTDKKVTDRAKNRTLRSSRQQNNHRHHSPPSAPPPGESLWIYALLARRRMAHYGRT